MLLNDQRLTERHHKADSEETAEQRDQEDRHKARELDLAFLCPEEQGRQCKDRTCRQRLTGRTDSLNQVVFENGIPAEDHTNNTH